MLQGMRFRPKGNSGVSQGTHGFLPAPATFGRIRSVRSNRVVLLLVVVFLLWVLDPFRMVPKFGPENVKYPPSHPFGSKHTIETSSRFIYPPIEHADLLRSIGIENLMYQAPEGTIASLNILDAKDPLEQKHAEETENAESDNAKAKNAFKNQEKVVFRPNTKKNYPKVVVVTAVDFTKYSVASLVKIVQNRVNYGHLHNYGIYVRWYQEFAPQLESLDFVNDRERAKWARLFCLQAAMFAFPDADWFWYLDQDALIVNLQVNLQSYLLSPDALKSAILRQQPVIPPNGLIKTHKSLQPSNVKLIFTQSETKIETNSFVVRNDVVGRATIDTWSDKLFLDYNNFPFGPDSAITHILQWHPFILSKTAIVSARMINSFHDKSVRPENKASDHSNYFSGDLVVQWSKVNSKSEREEALQQYSPNID